MSYPTDPAIKLFGKTIPLQDFNEALSCDRRSDSKQLTSKEARDRIETALGGHNLKTPTYDDESQKSETPKTEDDQSDTKNSQDKLLKKPDKILPCPRCNSMDTKFCYYNNYNVSQPRHFCKNCQRYWTAGGIMRNVPVGAGRRKNKNPASQYRHVTASEEGGYSAHYPTVKPNGTLLTFGSGTPHCDSMASVFIADKNVHKPEAIEISDRSSMSSLVASANVNDENGQNSPNIMQNCRIYPPQLPFFAGPTWPYPAQWVPPPGVYPMPFYPAPPFWGYTIQPPWVTPPPSASPISPTLGKHCRDEDSSRQSDLGKEEEERKESGNERSLWIPKTLRIDDPGEAAKSSIWATLGIKHEKRDLIGGGGGKGGIFKAFYSKANEKSDISDSSHVLQANPAALSRSRSFHESS